MSFTGNPQKKVNIGIGLVLASVACIIALGTVAVPLFLISMMFLGTSARAMSKKADEN